MSYIKIGVLTLLVLLVLVSAVDTAHIECRKSKLDWLKDFCMFLVLYTIFYGPVAILIIFLLETFTGWLSVGLDHVR